MARFEIGTPVEVISSGRIGTVINKLRKSVVVEFFDKSSVVPEVRKFNYHELMPVELPQIRTSQLGPFVRGEISLTELSNGVHLIAEYVKIDSKPYKVTAEDILIGIKHYEGMTDDDIFRWLDIIMQFGDDMSFPSNSWTDIQDEVTEKDFLSYVYNELNDIHWELCIGRPEEIVQEYIKNVSEQLEKWVGSDGKEYPEEIRQIIAAQYDCDDIDRQSEATQKLLKECLDYCCDVKKDPKAIQRRGYCYYCGTKIYPNDWHKAKDAFLDYYQMTGDASAANTLGYIYYYGRCSGGVPEYEEAFKYFSIGHAYSYYESTYKLADMLAHGYGVVKDGKSAYHLYLDVYADNLKRFIRGDFESKFADAALRMGNCYRDGTGVDKDLESAYYYYLQADYAIRERTKVANHYGDTVVFNGIQKAITEVKAEYTERGRSVKFFYPEWTKWVLINHRRCKLVINKLKDDVLAIDATVLKRKNEDKAPQMFITVSKADYCALRKKIRIKTAQKSRYETFSEKSEIIFDSIEFNQKECKTSFYLYDDLVGEIYTDYYTFLAPAKKRIPKTGDFYHFVSVCFDESGRCYDYLCDDPSVAEGDFVVVNGYDGEKTVKVVNVANKHESELGLPIERYKKIVRKI